MLASPHRASESESESEPAFMHNSALYEPACAVAQDDEELRKMLMVVGSNQIDGIKVDWYWEEDTSHIGRHARDHVLAGTSFVKYHESVAAQLEFHYCIAAQVTTCTNTTTSTLRSSISTTVVHTIINNIIIIY